MLGQGDTGIGGQPESPREAHRGYQSIGATLHQEFREIQTKDVKNKDYLENFRDSQLEETLIEGHTPRKTGQLMH